MSSLSRQRLFAVIVALLSTCAFAQPKRVFLEAVGDASDVKALEASLADWLEAMQLELETVSALPPVSEASFARVRAVWTEATCIVEVFSGQGALRRRKELPRGGPPLLVSESAALIAQAGVQELTIEEQRRKPLATPTEGAPPPELAPEDLPPFGVRLAAWGQGRIYGEQTPMLFGGGVELGAIFGDGAWRPGATVLVGYQGPVSANTESFTIQMQAVEFRLLASLERRVGLFKLEFGLGGGLDLLVASTSSTSLDPRYVTESRVDPAPFISASVGLRWMFSRSASVFARLVADVDPARRVYAVNIEGERQTLLVPWIGRPALQLGVAFDPLSRPERAP
ncbi:MAG TPA: hypothetical protein VGD87_12115 [Archangium sp.]